MPGAARSAGGRHCWLCGSDKVVFHRPSSLPVAAAGAELVRITDASYGVTADIFRCEDCGFLQCSDFTDVLQSYEDMVDPRYEETRGARAMQAAQILSRVPGLRAGQRLLDVGAGSGILVEEALKLGVKAEGVEPSHWLQARAAAAGLPVTRGVLPNAAAQGPYDVVTVVDVIEHVPDPVGLMKQCTAVLAPEGVAAVITPDVGSLTARLLGAKWWHYRPAHIGYFDVSTLTLALRKAGLRAVAVERARWVLPADYLWERVMHYAPGALRTRPPALLRDRRISLNLFDSLFIFAKKETAA